MRILGISPLDTTTTVSFMEDGAVVFACAEERLSRVKLQDGFPRLALQEGFKRTGWSPESIEIVAYGFFDGETETKLMEEAFAKDAERYDSNCTAASLEALQKALEVPAPHITLWFASGACQLCCRVHLYNRKGIV